MSMSMSMGERAKKSRRKNNERSRRNSKKSENKSSDGNLDLDFKDAKDLQEDYEKIINCIQNDEIQDMLNLMNNSDMKYFLLYNDLDYSIFRSLIIFKRYDGILKLINAGYTFNTNTLLIELYDLLTSKKDDMEKSKEINKEFFLNEDDRKFIITFKNGDLIDKEKCIVEFYFLLLCNEFELATILLSQDYARHIRDYFNEIFFGDENNLLKHILEKEEIVKLCVKHSLVRQLDGVAL